MKQTRHFDYGDGFLWQIYVYRAALLGGGTRLINKPLKLHAGILKPNVCFPVEVLCSVTRAQIY